MLSSGNGTIGRSSRFFELFCEIDGTSQFEFNNVFYFLGSEILDAEHVELLRSPSAKQDH